MNPLPFFPPPARAFSQTGRGGPPPNGASENRLGLTLSRRQTSAGGSGSGRPKSSGTSQQSSSTSLRKTFSQHGSKILRDRGAECGSAGPPTPGSTGPREGSYLPSPREQSPRSDRDGVVSFSTRSPRKSSIGQQHTQAAAGTQPTGSSLTSSVMSKSSSNSSSSNSGEAESSQNAVSDSRKPSRLSPSQPFPGDGQQDRSPSGSSLALNKKNRSATLPIPSGRTGANLPKGLTFDWVRPDEVSQCHALEKTAYDPEDQASRDRMAYRQKAAPHLFLGAFVPAASPKVAGPLSVGYFSTPRKLVGYVNGTASCNFSARSLSYHAVANEETGEEAWLVCLHSIAVADEYRRKGLGLRLLEEYMMRLRRAEEGRGDASKGSLEKAKGYEHVAVLSHEETMRFFRKAGFKEHALSHVRVGSGNWVEMRRPVKSQPHQEKDEESPNSEKEKQRERETKKGASEVGLEQSAARQRSASRPEALAPIGIPYSRNASPHPPHQPLRASSPDSAKQENSPDSESNQASGGESLKASSMAGGGSSLGNFTQADLLAALSASSQSYAPGQNPSLAFSSVLGQTLAGKTFVEDAFVALEARLVDKRKGTIEEIEDGGPGANLAEIWCPREECGCKIIAKGVATWELAESGPLTDADLAMASLPNGAGALPPTPVPPPAPASHIRALKERERERARKPEKKNKEDKEGPPGIRSTLPGAPPSGEVSTPIRPFWSLLSPMSFDNIGFTKDVSWTVPVAGGSGSSQQSHQQPAHHHHTIHYHPRSGSHQSSAGGALGSGDESGPGSSSWGAASSASSSRKSSVGAGSNGLGPLTISAPIGPDGSPHKMPAGDGQSDSKTQRAKPSRRGTFFTSRKEKEREKEREREREKERTMVQHANAAAAMGATAVPQNSVNPASPRSNTTNEGGGGGSEPSMNYFGQSSMPASPGTQSPPRPSTASSAHHHQQSSMASPTSYTHHRDSDASTRSQPPPSNTSSQRKLTIKYLLCPQCDTGPLGYTIVPSSLEGNKMGHATGEEERSGNSKKEREIQVFLVAAERVRYRFAK